MKDETYALALWALQEERGNVWLALSYNSEATLQSLQAELARFDAAIADLEAEQAAPRPVAMPDQVEETIRNALIANRRKALDWTHWDEWHTRKVDAALAWLDQLQRRPEAQP